jgi:hypothetical protein
MLKGAGTSGSLADPHFIDAAAGAPTIANPVIELWARKGVDTTVRMVYHAAAGAHDSVTYYSLRVRAQSLFRRPDGSAIADGDSVLITLTVTDPAHLIIDFQPSGLRFSGSDPARLRMFFGECGDDLNDDGKVDGGDDGVEQQLSIWRREQPTDPWQRLSSVNVKDNKEIDANLAGFTGYALAY